MFTPSPHDKVDTYKRRLLLNNYGFLSYALSTQQVTLIYFLSKTDSKFNIQIKFRIAFDSFTSLRVVTTHLINQDDFTTRA